MMTDTPTSILISYSKVLSNALVKVYENGPKRHKTLKIDLTDLKGLTHEQLINSNQYSELVQKFNTLKDPCVYWFEILGNYDIDTVWNAFQAFKDSHTHKLPRSKTKAPRDTNILYLGKVKFNLLRRMKEHLGFTTATKTQSLQLCHWATELGLEIEINVLEFEQETSNLVGAFEFKLAREMKTILGSHTT